MSRCGKTGPSGPEEAARLLYFVAGVGIDTDHGEFYCLPLDDYVSEAEGILWEARVGDPRLADAWAWCFSHCYPGGWRDEDGARSAYFDCRRAVPDRGRIRQTREFLERERRRAAKAAFCPASPGRRTTLPEE